MVSSLVELQDRYRDEGLVIIGIDVGDEEAEWVKIFTEERGVNYINLMADRKVVREYQIRAHPFTVLVTPQGAIFTSYLGAVEKEVLEKDIKALLSQ